MPDILKCLRCNGDMVEGAVVYRTSEEVKTGFGRERVGVEAEWVSGYLESYAP